MGQMSLRDLPRSSSGEEGFYENEDMKKIPSKQERVAAARNYLLELALVCDKCQKVPVQFHHVEPRRKGIDLKVSTLVERGASLTRIEEELAKCRPLCNRCHASLHAKQKHADGVLRGAFVKGTFYASSSNTQRTDRDRPCSDCGIITDRLRKGLCGRCYQSARREEKRLCSPKHLAKVCAYLMAASP